MKTCSVDDYRKPMTRHDIMVLLFGCIFGIALMAAVHVALSAHADRIHAKQVATIQAADKLLRDKAGVVLSECQKDLARYDEIAQLEADVVAAMGDTP